MTSLPFVTVGIITKNEAEHIGETINSVLNLNYPRGKYEILIVDGNSIDGTNEIVNKISKKSKVKIRIFNEKDYGFYGPCFARNLVIQFSSNNSKYIAFTDADCKVEKNWLTKLVSVMEEHKRDPRIVGIGGPRFVHPNDKGVAKAINFFLSSGAGSGWRPTFSPRNLKFVKSIANYNALYRKPILKKYPYDSKLITSDDSELNFRLTRLGFKFLYAPKVKVFHHSEGSIKQFIKHMFAYGENISRTIRKHKAIPRWYALIPSFSILILVIGLFLSFFIKSMLPFLFILVGFYFLFISYSALVIIITKRSMFGLYAFILAPLQHLFYGLGVFYGLFINTRMKDWRVKWNYK